MATVNFANGPPAVVQMPDEQHHGGPGTFETDETKAMHYHYEGTGVSDILAHTEEPLYMSYDIKETARHFWKAVMVSMAVSWGACYDAYVTSGESFKPLRCACRSPLTRSQSPRTCWRMKGSSFRWRL